MPENTLDNPSKLVVRVRFPSPARSVGRCHPQRACTRGEQLVLYRHGPRNGWRRSSAGQSATSDRSRFACRAVWRSSKTAGPLRLRPTSRPTSSGQAGTGPRSETRPLVDAAPSMGARRAPASGQRSTCLNPSDPCLRRPGSRGLPCANPDHAPSQRERKRISLPWPCPWSPSLLPH
jgi:hypothetical protein